MFSRLSPAALWIHVRSSYWFLPSVVTLGAIALALGTTTADRYVIDEETSSSWFYAGGADGARALLSAVAGSMITVVSVTFSVTIVALTVSSQHFGPRLLNNFMRDRAAQLVLGTFIGTFAYCLLVLRTVQGEGDGYERFVPHLAVTVAVVLTLLSVAALIFYVHHVSMSMQVSEIALGVVKDLESAIDRLYPEGLGDAAELAPLVPLPSAASAVVPFESSGYVQHIEPDAIVDLAREADVVIWLQVQPGDFATEGLALGCVEPPPQDGDAFRRRLNRAVILGADRTSQQDVGFPMQQLVEVALHALSTGMNEPFTAITCIDRLGQGLARILTRRLPSDTRADESGRVRVVTLRDTFADVLDNAFGPIEAHVGESPEVGTHMLRVLGRLARLARREGDLRAIERHADQTRHHLIAWFREGAYKEPLEGAYGDVRINR